MEQDFNNFERIIILIAFSLLIKDVIYIVRMRETSFEIYLFII